MYEYNWLSCECVGAECDYGSVCGSMPLCMRMPDIFCECVGAECDHGSVENLCENVVCRTTLLFSNFFRIFLWRRWLC